MRKSLRAELRGIIEKARSKDASLSWSVLARRAGMDSRTAFRKMLQGEAPIDDETARRIAATVGYELALRRAR